MTSASKFWKNAGTRAAVQGALLAILSNYVEGDISVNATLVGKISLPMANLVAGAGAALINDVTHSYILPHIPQTKKYSTQESAVLSPLISIASLGGVLWLINPRLAILYGIPRIAISGTVADIGSHYIQDNFITPMI